MLKMTPVQVNKLSQRVVEQMGYNEKVRFYPDFGQMTALSFALKTVINSVFVDDQFIADMIGGVVEGKCPGDADEFYERYKEMKGFKVLRDAIDDILMGKYKADESGAEMPVGFRTIEIKDEYFC